MTESKAWQSAHGKVILFGEHAVVYGERAVAASISDAMLARAKLTDNTTRITVPDWGVDLTLGSSDRKLLLYKLLELLSAKLGLSGFTISLKPSLPPASGLGASAAVAVASIRSLNIAFAMGMTDYEINELAFACEKLAHGNPSGLDNTLSTYGGLVEYWREAETAHFRKIPRVGCTPFLVAQSGVRGFTSEMVSKVKTLRDRDKLRVDELFERIRIAKKNGVEAMQSQDYKKLGRSLDENHVCLKELGVSCEKIEKVCRVARDHGAWGAKLTGSGGGGSVLILPSNSTASMQNVLNEAGFESSEVMVSSAS